MAAWAALALVAVGVGVALCVPLSVPVRVPVAVPLADAVLVPEGVAVVVAVVLTVRVRVRCIDVSPERALGLVGKCPDPHRHYSFRVFGQSGP